jgi:hypothetical protein
MGTEGTQVSIIDVTPYEREAQALTLTSPETATAAMLFIAKVREAEKNLDAERKAKTDPLRAQIEQVATPYKMAIEAFAKLRLKVQGALNVYEERAQAKRLEDQRKANAEADRVRFLQYQKEEAARLEANRLREAGDLVGALKQDTKADKAGLAAAMAAPTIIDAPPKTVQFDGGLSVTMRKTKDWAYLNGEVRGEKRYLDDPRFAVLETEKHVLLIDETKISAIVRSGGKIAGIRVFDVMTPVSSSKKGS